MSHIAMYRAWRPQAFMDVVGQRHIIQTLQNSLKENRFTHAYLFSGPRGTGKTSAAKILAKALNCEHGPAPEPCNACSACKGVTEGTVLDVVEIDAASNRGVEEIRDVRDKVKYAPTEVRFKVYIIDEVHMLTTEAFNALLKTLEEPPPHVVFILATTEPGRIPATIISRCQRFDFRRVELEDQISRLEHICRQEAIDVEPEALQLLARMSDGGMRDALSMLDQVISFGGQRVTYQDVLTAMGGLANEQFAQLAEALHGKDIGKVLEIIDSLMQEGKSAEQCLESLIHYFRDLLLVKMVPNAQSMTDRILDPGQFSNVVERYGHEEIFRIIDILNHYQVEMKYSQQPKLLFEIAMMKICTSTHPESGNGVEAQSQTTPAAQSGFGSSVEAGMSGGSIVAKHLELEKKITQLEQRIEQLTSEGTNTVGGQGIAESASSRGAADASAVQRRNQGRSHTPMGGAAAQQKLSVFLQEVKAPRTKEVLMQWNQVLQMVRDAKVTVHAWLVDGEPVSVTEDSVLVAFKNTIHRETTEKPANRQLIEQVLKTIFQTELGLVTVMLKDWNEALAAHSGEGTDAATEPLELQYEEGHANDPASDTGKDTKGQYKEEWINEAIELFGENLVEIKEET